MKTLEILNSRPIWVVYINTDLTEGRGSNYPIFWCESEITARRLAIGRNTQGSDGEVFQQLMYYVTGNMWLAPSGIPCITPMSKEDTAEMSRLSAHSKKIAATVKARALGLTEEDIAALLSQAL